LFGIELKVLVPVPEVEGSGVYDFTKLVVVPSPPIVRLVLKPGRLNLINSLPFASTRLVPPPPS
jgi:hypothetical protein